MDYLTNYYKNLSEQLQAKVNNLQKLLTEMEIANVDPSVSPIAGVEYAGDTDADLIRPREPPPPGPSTWNAKERQIARAWDEYFRLLWEWLQDRNDGVTPLGPRPEPPVMRPPPGYTNPYPNIPPHERPFVQSQGMRAEQDR